MVKLRLGKKELTGILLVSALLFFFALFGLTGLRFIIGVLLLFFLPVYFILSSFDIQADEKSILSVLLGIILFPSIAYWLGLFISLRASILITFAALLLIGFALNRYRSHKEAEKINSTIFF